MKKIKMLQCATGLAIGAVLGLGLSGPVGAADHSEPAPFASQPSETDLITTWMADYFAPRFTVVSGLLNGALLAEAQTLSQAHTARMHELLMQWTRETGSARTAFVRLANAFALWGLDSTGDDHDVRWLQALQSPGACYRGERHDASELEIRLHALQSLPPGVLALALADERKLLARWGQPDQAVNAAQPVAPFAEYDDWKGAPLPANAPALGLQRQLAIWLLQPDAVSGKGGGVMPPGLSCVANQMALRAVLAIAENAPVQQTKQGQQALMRWRESQKMTAAALLWTPVPAILNSSGGLPAYPRFAVQFGVEGSVKSVVWVDALGAAPRAAVVQRDLVVGGLPAGQRPAAFEALLDAASIAHAQAAVAGRLLTPGERLEQTLVWKIE